MSEAETLTMIVILLAGIGLLVLNQIRKNKKALLALVDKAEDKIEDVTGLDIELSEAVEEVLDKALDTADELLEDIEEDGELDADLEEAIEEVKKMTVAQLKASLNEKGLPISGKKAELVERLLRGVA